MNLTKNNRWKGLGEKDDAAVARHVAALDEVFSVYDVILSKQPYLAGEEITLADLSHLPHGNSLHTFGHGDLFEKYPNVKRWWTSLSERESWKKVLSG